MIIAIYKLFAFFFIFHFTIGYNVKFEYFFKWDLKFQNPIGDFLWKLRWIIKKSLVEKE